MPSPVRFPMLRKMLEDDGWVFARSKGAHFHFTKAGRRTMVVAVHGGKVAPVYVREIEKAISEGRRLEASDEAGSA